MRKDHSTNWNDLKLRAKEQWSKLSDDDLARVDSGIDDLVGMIQVAYGTTKAEAERQVASFKNQCGYGCEDNDPRALEPSAPPRKP